MNPSTPPGIASTLPWSPGALVAALLDQRIRFAADQVCGVSDQRDLTRLANAKACADQAIAAAAPESGKVL